MKNKPIVDRQILDEISRLISESILDHTTVSVEVVSDHDHEVIKGKIERIDQQLGKVMIVSEESVRWVPFREIVEIWQM